MTGRPPPGRLRLPKAPAIVEDNLGGGLYALAVRRRSVPLVQVRLSFRVAAEHLRRSAGPTVLAESLLAGTDRRDRQGLAEAVELLGGRIVASQGDDRFLVSASVLAERLDELLRLLAEVLHEASYPPEDVRTDRERLANETLIALSQPDVIADEALRRRLYGKHPYAAEIPRPGALRRISAEHLRRLHPGLLDPASAALVLVGDVEPRRALASAASSLASWLAASGSSDVDLEPLPPVQAGPIRFVAREASVQSNVRLGRRAPSRSDPDWPATALANLIFGGMFASRLVENLRERHGYTYSPRSAVRHARAGSSLIIQADVGREATAAALVEMRYELGRMAVGGVSDDELEAARRYALGSFTFLTGTHSGLADTLATLASSGVGPSYLTTYPAAVAKVSRRDVEAAARCYLAPAGFATVIVGDAAETIGRLEAVDTVEVHA